MSFFQKPSRDAATEGRLLARPMQQTETAPLGLQPLGLDGDRSNGGTGGDRDGLLYVPKSYRANQPAPLVLMMHGAGGTPVMDCFHSATLLIKTDSFSCQ
jgi:poly(3-hydroxybutyrate) depolymerase